MRPRHMKERPRNLYWKIRVAQSGMRHHKGYICVDNPGRFRSKVNFLQTMRIGKRGAMYRARRWCTIRHQRNYGISL